MKLSVIRSYITIIVTCLCATNSAYCQQNVNWQGLVEKWNSAHDSTRLAELAGIYGDTVLYYGRKTAREKCITGKRQLLRKYRAYVQTISGTVKAEGMTDGQMKCSFVKHVAYDGKEKDYPSYLVFRNHKGGWVIATESDEVTDKNLAQKKEKQRMPKDAVAGDFNGDGKKEYMWLVAPETVDTDMDCVGDCNCLIKFSDPTIPAITVTSCIGGSPVNEHDLNDNGTDEIGLLPDWFSSCWHDYCVWTLIKGKWQYAVKPFSTHCEQWEKGIIPIEKDKKHPGKVIIRYMEMGDADFKFLQKSVDIVK